MNVGFVGLGKLGLPVATAMAARGLTVYGYDPHVTGYPDDLSYEDGFDDLVRRADGRVRFCSLAEVVANTDGVVFVAVQTPHEPRFEGVTSLPEDRADFDYSHLRSAVSDLVAAGFSGTVCVISTVLPGTMRREILPLLGDRVGLVYNPSFIAMGTTIRDFLDPEFVLLGGDDDCVVHDVYQRITVGHEWPHKAHVSVQDAELIKVAYNTFIGLKIAFANTLMEVCHKTGCDVDEVTGALKLAHRRLISPAYMDGGMGDGGGCHPRDNIALSWLARELNLSYDLFGAAMECREDQASWLADLLEQHDLPKAIVGFAYKPGSHLTTGSSARLVGELLRKRGHRVQLRDPHADNGLFDLPLDGPHAILIGCKHPDYADHKFPAGSVVLDPFRYILDQDGVTVVRVGAGPTGTVAQSTHARVAA